MTRKGTIMAKKKTRQSEPQIGLTQQLTLAEEIDLAYFEKELNELRENDVDDLNAAVISAIRRLIKKDDARNFTLIDLVDPTVDLEPFESPDGFTANVSYCVDRIAAIPSPLPGIMLAPEAASLVISVIIVSAEEEEYECYLPLSADQAVEVLVTEENVGHDGVGPLEVLLDWLESVGRSAKKTKKARA